MTISYDRVMHCWTQKRSLANVVNTVKGLDLFRERFPDKYHYAVGHRAGKRKLSPWLSRGGAIEFRRQCLAQGFDWNEATLPDWVEAGIARLNQMFDEDRTA